jgi:hypothetical protein
MTAAGLDRVVAALLAMTKEKAGLAALANPASPE